MSEVQGLQHLHVFVDHSTFRLYKPNTSLVLAVVPWWVYVLTSKMNEYDDDFHVRDEDDDDSVNGSDELVLEVHRKTCFHVQTDAAAVEPAVIQHIVFPLDVVVVDLLMHV